MRSQLLRQNRNAGAGADVYTSVTDSDVTVTQVKQQIIRKMTKQRNIAIGQFQQCSFFFVVVLLSPKIQKQQPAFQETLFLSSDWKDSWIRNQVLFLPLSLTFAGDLFLNNSTGGGVSTDRHRSVRPSRIKAHSHRALALPLRCASVLLPMSSMGKSNGFVHTQHDT